MKFVLSVLLIASTFFPSVANAKYFEPYEVDNSIGLTPGDILVNTNTYKLAVAIDSDTLKVYPIAVGRKGLEWKGVAKIGRTAENPAWHPTESQRKKKKLPKMVKGGPGNPLGAYALYLYKNGNDTLYRIHGTNAPSSIGKSVSDGCIRMRNNHVLDLAVYVEIGAKVTVL
jgi:lipoprotein-anchoring transpeptidase ErfK/SrfK